MREGGSGVEGEEGGGEEGVTEEPEEVDELREGMLDSDDDDGVGVRLRGVVFKVRDYSGGEEKEEEES